MPAQTRKILLRTDGISRFLSEGPQLFGHPSGDPGVGYGPVGRSVHKVLQDAGLATVVIDMNMATA